LQLAMAGYIGNADNISTNERYNIIILLMILTTLYFGHKFLVFSFHNCGQFIFCRGSICSHPNTPLSLTYLVVACNLQSQQQHSIMSVYFCNIIIIISIVVVTKRDSNQLNIWLQFAGADPGTCKGGRSLPLLFSLFPTLLSLPFSLSSVLTIIPSFPRFFPLRLSRSLKPARWSEERCRVRG